MVLLPLAPPGMWLGVRRARRISPTLFYRCIYICMFLTVVKLLWDAVH